jgi:hypothetical protein
VEAKDDGIFTLGASWTRNSWTDAFGGTYISSSKAGNYVQVAFTGREAALIAPKYATAGRATVYCDDVSKGLVDLYAATLSARRVATPRCEFSVSAAHTMKLVLEGTTGRPRFDVDAFIVLR